ncbi:GtrA family protein [Streptosporangium subroseum]|uniref:GtrA family protein n=1 Tax=Streptosporangium subroseum TaxID=106412 RepID=UPI00343AF211
METRAVHDKDSHFGRRALISALGGNRTTYLLVGAMTAVVYYALLGLALLIAGDEVPYLFLVMACHMVTVVVIYPWCRLVVFRDCGQSWLRGLLKFYAVGLSFLVVCMVGLPFLVEFLGIPIMIAQALLIVVNPPLSYAIHRTWTFRRSGKL